MSAAWQPVGFDLTFIVLLSLTAVLTVASLALVPTWRKRKKGRRDSFDDAGLGFGAFALALGVLAVLFAVILACVTFPYQSRYLHVYRVTGHVMSVSNVLTNASGDLSQSPVVVLNTVDRPIVVDDSRVLDYAGKDVTLACEVAWHYQAQDSYSCALAVTK